MAMMFGFRVQYFKSGHVVTCLFMKLIIFSIFSQERDPTEFTHSNFEFKHFCFQGLKSS